MFINVVIRSRTLATALACWQTEVACCAQCRHVGGGEEGGARRAAALKCGRDVGDVRVQHATGLPGHVVREGGSVHRQVCAAALNAETADASWQHGSS